MSDFISIEEATALLSAGAQVIDVRTPGEWAEGHADGSTLLPLNELPNRFGELSKDAALLMVCRSGGRSEQATQFLRAMGYERVFNLGPWQRNPTHTA